MDTKQYRRIIGHFATGITVVTTRVGELYHGMTANAVCSVSLDPLLLLVCVDKKATCHQQMTSAGRFAINILGEEQEEISNLFARAQDAHRGGLPGVGHRLSGSGVPLIDGCLGYFVCRVAHAHEGGDHTIFVGEVEEGDLDEKGPSGDRPLLYYASAYRRLADG